MIGLFRKRRSPDVVKEIDFSNVKVIRIFVDFDGFSDLMVIEVSVLG